VSDAPLPKPVDIARVLDNARFGTLRWLNEEPAEWDTVYTAATRLLSLLEERDVDYVVAGGLAVLQYVDGRNTQDIDLILSSEDLERLPELERFEEGPDFVRARFDGVVVDALLTCNDLFALVRERFTTVRRFAHGDARCATPEGLLLMKLYALPSLYRQGQFERVTIYEGDVANLLQRSGIDPEPLLRLLEPYVLPSDLAQIRVITAEIQGRISRFEAGRPDTEPGKA